MKYTKPPLTWEQQADLLLSRGMQADRDTLIARLQSVNYYRLSGYWYPFRKSCPDGNKQDCFNAETAFDDIWERYVFDRQLRVLTLDAIERFEVFLRCQLSYHLAHSTGSFACDDRKNFPQSLDDTWEKFTNSCKKDLANGEKHTDFVKHFYKKYGDGHASLPIWMLCELFSFGTLFSLYKLVDPTIQQEIAKGEFGIDRSILKSWIGALHAARNICAHHDRFFNRILGYKPQIPRAWTTTINNKKIFSLLTILRYLLKRIAAQSRWPNKIIALLKEHPTLLGEMGFPQNWENYSEWN